MKRYDVIVVGAGPCGSTAARLCAREGLSTLQLERSSIPRVKPCAGGVTLGAARELDFEIPEKLIERRCTGMRVRLEKVVNEIQVSEPVALMVTRSSFDEHLADRARETGAELLEGTACRSVEPGEHGIRVLTEAGTFMASLVIGADGYFSTVLKSLNYRFEQDEIRFCVLADVPMSEQEIDQRFGNSVFIHYGYVSHGYAWIFPKKAYLSTGIGGAFQFAKELPDQLRRFLSSHGIRNERRIRGCFIPVSRWRWPIYADRVLLAGDAAGLVDAFSGEGIRYAIASGKLAAETAVAAHGRGDFSSPFLRRYQLRCRERIGTDLQASVRVTDLLFRYPNLLLGTAVRNEEALLTYTDSIRGEISFSDFVAWLKARMPRYFIKRILHLR
jgi:geranylgeranyl reductase family protein